MDRIPTELSEKESFFFIPYSLSISGDRRSPVFFRRFAASGNMNEIIRYLTIHGECADTEISGATGIPLTDVRIHLSALVSQRAIMACRSIRFEQGKEIEEMICRLTGYIRPATPGRKSK